MSNMRRLQSGNVLNTATGVIIQRYQNDPADAEEWWAWAMSLEPLRGDPRSSPIPAVSAGLEDARAALTQTNLELGEKVVALYLELDAAKGEVQDLKGDLADLQRRYNQLDKDYEGLRARGR